MPSRHDQRVDWFRLLSDLKQAGHAIQMVATRIHTPKSTILGWKSGAEPKHCDGERLVALWICTTGQGRDFIPMQRYEMSAAKINRS